MSAAVSTGAVTQTGHTNIGVLQIIGAGAEQMKMAESVLSGDFSGVTSTMSGPGSRPVSRPPLGECV